jgi:hypothetical protein
LTGYEPEIDDLEEGNALAELCRDEAWVEESSSQ